MEMDFWCVCMCVLGCLLVGHNTAMGHFARYVFMLNGCCCPYLTYGSATVQYSTGTAAQNLLAAILIICVVSLPCHLHPGSHPVSGQQPVGMPLHDGSCPESAGHEHRNKSEAVKVRTGERVDVSKCGAS